MDGLLEYALLAGFVAVGLAVGVAATTLPLLISPRGKGPKTTDTYECGIDTVGSAWIRFDISYYLFALVFVAFEVDVLYLLPVAVVYGEYAWRDLVEISLFLGILLLALAYAWRKGVFRWR